MAKSVGHEQTDSEAFSKRYGDTVLRKDASARLGDISQDVNFNGGVHLHIHPRLDQVAAAGVIVELVQVSKQLLAFGKALLADRKNAPETQKQAYFLQHFSQVQLKLHHYRGLGSLGVHAPAEAQVRPSRSSVLLPVTAYHAHLLG